jgi:hypothetical protein
LPFAVANPKLTRLQLPTLPAKGLVGPTEICRYVDPAALPIERPTKFETVLNMRTARALGISIPTSVWTGRAVQAGCDDLEINGLAHLYSAR